MGVEPTRDVYSPIPDLKFEMNYSIRLNISHR